MIKNLLFDLGWVIMDIEKENCVQAYRELGLRNAEKYFGEFSQQGPFMLLEEGAISADEFHAYLRPELPAEVTDAQIDEAFCKFLTGIPVHRLAALRQLRRRYKVFMLSNTNPIMWNSRISEEFCKEGRVREDYFDGMVTSFEARALKPDRRIFDYAVNKLGREPDETLFLDDSETNLKAASKLGFNTALVAPGMEFTDIIEKYKDA